MRAPCLLMAAVLVTALATGCGGQSPPGAAASSASPTSASSPQPTLSTSPGPTTSPVRIIGYPADADARADIAKAVAAAKDGRYVLLDFGATWCPDCVVLERYFGDRAVTTVLDRQYHVVSVDVGRFNRNMDLLAQYAPGSKGIPTLVLLGPDGKRIADSGTDYVNAASDRKGAQEFAAYLRAWPSRGR